MLSVTANRNGIINSINKETSKQPTTKKSYKKSCHNTIKIFFPCADELDSCEERL